MTSVFKSALLMMIALLGTNVLRAAEPPVSSSRTTAGVSSILTPKAAATPRINGPKIFGARPGHYNDADMLVVGQVGGWSSHELHASNLTPDEQYTHISLWCLLASPLFIGTDFEKMDDFTLSLLTNDEVLEINQDTLCRQATQVGGEGEIKIYTRPLDDGSWAVGLFNLGHASGVVRFNWAMTGPVGQQRVRDLWRQIDIGVMSDKFEAPVAPHGVVLVRIFPSPSPAP